ncbi:unnamed protein product [Staurois parvus]|uniref:Uncharacterized protein n=1 Tax=Staurois parvus TaxID=386267 RepID=A0ABN9F218_9NEOB|nr:unnamed protein product [Staurois parvus]
MPLAFFWVYFECGQGHRGPHDPLLPGGPISCQSATGPGSCGCTATILRSRGGLTIWALPEGLGSVGGPMRCPWYLFHRLF